jgi:hypothetical protein
MPLYLVKTLNYEEFSRTINIKNPIEKNCHQLLAMDFPEQATIKSLESIRFPEEKIYE